MSSNGIVGWFDLTVDDAEQVSQFYEQVVGWKKTGLPMNDGEYEDFCMLPAEGKDPIGGICHKRGDNREFPSQWLIYINVEDLNKSMETCQGLGGKVVYGPRSMGSYGTMCVIEDPAGAVAALIQPSS